MRVTFWGSRVWGLGFHIIRIIQKMRLGSELGSPILGKLPLGCVPCKLIHCQVVAHYCERSGYLIPEPFAPTCEPGFQVRASLDVAAAFTARLRSSSSNILGVIRFQVESSKNPRSGSKQLTVWGARSLGRGL